MSLPDPDRVAAIYALCALLALWVGWIVVLRPKWRRFWSRIDGAIDTLGGRKEFVDQATGHLVPEVQPLGIRIGGIEQTLAVVADQQQLLENHETRLTALENDRVKEIVASAERAATAAASVEAFRMVTDRDTVDGEADEPPAEPAGELGD